MTRSSLLLLALALAGCSEGEPAAPLRQRLHPGMTRQEVLELAGEPADRREGAKSGDAIWGPEEEWWHEVPAGARYEAWTWSGDEGTTGVYFFEGADTVSRVTFYPAGVVYEAVTEPAGTAVDPADK